MCLNVTLILNCSWTSLHHVIPLAFITFWLGGSLLFLYGAKFINYILDLAFTLALLTPLIGLNYYRRI